MNSKDKIRLVVSCLCMILAFFCGYLYAQRQYVIEKEKHKDTAVYIDVKTTRKSIQIQETPKNIFFRVNGALMQSGSIDLK